ncbi:MAG: hypothetical protein E7546_03390 [Ruminococcaceae bacterium]|nr:hypothetical protein [Oscillospiraceae bacterium]
MPSYVNPSLPHSKVLEAVCGDNEEAVRMLEGFGISVISPESDSRLPKPVRSHADMLCCHIAPDFVYAYDKELPRKLESLGVKCAMAEHIPSDVYPEDAALNCAVLGKYLIANEKTASVQVLSHASSVGLEIINVRQGYARCTTAIIDENSVITADRGIVRALREKGIDVLLINPGGIELPGYGYGFIGGTCGKICDDTILFMGDPMTHPDGGMICDFISSKNIKIVHTEGNLFDFGGFIPVRCQ